MDYLDNMRGLLSLLETVSSQGQDTEALTKMRRQKQQNPDHSAPTLPGFHR